MEKDAIRAMVEGNKRMELDKLQVLVGKTVRDVLYDNTNDYGQPIEGVYTLVFTDGTSASFSSSGDDATCTTFEFDAGT